MMGQHVINELTTSDIKNQFINNYQQSYTKKAFFFTPPMINTQDVDFYVKVLNISRQIPKVETPKFDIYRSPYFKQSEENNDSLHSSHNHHDSLTEVNMYIFNRGQISYLNRSIAQVKSVMQRIQKRINSPTE